MAYYRGITNVVHLQLHKNNYFNIAKARRERREKQRNASVCGAGRSRWREGRGGAGREREGEEEAGKRARDQGYTSEREYEVDA
jgi:hypothetical protein